MATSTPSAMGNGITLRLPNGLQIVLETLDVPLGKLIELGRNDLKDPNITHEGFGALKYFVFVNTASGSLWDEHLDLRRTLATLFVSDGDVIELRLCNPAPDSDGRTLNPMRGVTKFVE